MIQHTAAPLQLQGCPPQALAASREPHLQCKAQARTCCCCVRASRSPRPSSASASTLASAAASSVASAAAVSRWPSISAGSRCSSSSHLCSSQRTRQHRSSLAGEGPCWMVRPAQETGALQNLPALLLPSLLPKARCL